MEPFIRASPIDVGPASERERKSLGSKYGLVAAVPRVFVGAFGDAGSDACITQAGESTLTIKVMIHLPGGYWASLL